MQQRREESPKRMKSNCEEPPINDLFLGMDRRCLYHFAGPLSRRAHRPALINRVEVARIKAAWTFLGSGRANKKVKSFLSVLASPVLGLPTRKDIDFLSCYGLVFVLPLCCCFLDMTGMWPSLLPLLLLLLISATTTVRVLFV
jgi:hypothetical protein